MSRKFNITYTYKVLKETTVTAENEKEARKKFKEFMPCYKIDEVWEVKDNAD